MTASPSLPCASCGLAVSGNFCSNCGASAGPRACARCHAELSAQARYCHRCGAGTAPAGLGASAERKAWLIAGITITVLLGAVLFSVWRGTGGPTVPDMANPGVAGAIGARGGAAGPGGGLPVGRAPDISQMSPKERFARLNDRVMEAATRGDSGTVVNFTPMALGAYAQLDSVDIDSRYHAAVLNLQIGNFPTALALADTIESEAAGNLFAALIRGSVAQIRNDSVTLRRVQNDFLRRYDAEITKSRVEYLDHRAVLDEFRQTALQRRAGSGAR